MIKILIVDDNKNNRMILNLLLEDYLDEHESFSCEIDEAENGKLAIQKAKETSYDIIFMDIMMPEMNGIEATKLIKEINKNVMIIAVSAIDDVDRQREILSSGAEDYISKPINADIFNSRIGNYFSLVESRNHKKFNPEAINNYTKEVFSRRLIFMITSDDALSEFWEYYLLSDTQRSEYLSDVVRVIYALGDLLLKLKTYFEVVVEESETQNYFTLTNIDKLNEKLLKLVMMKNQSVTQYIVQDGCISFSLSILVEAPTIQAPVTITEDKLPSVEVTQSAKISEPVENQIFSYIDPDDLEEVETYLSKLSSLLLLIGSGELENDEIVEIYTYLELIAKILTTYSESNTIGRALLELSDSIAGNIDVFRDNSTALAPMAKAFSNDLSTWNRMIFHDGAPSVDFLDDTISVNSKTISSMLNPQEETVEEDLDDIFDF